MSEDHAVGGGTPPLAPVDGDKIRNLRESKGLTQLYVATAVGVTTETISRWENRHYPAIKMENAQKLADTLGVAIEDILEAGEDEAGDSGEPRATHESGKPGPGESPPDRQPPPEPPSVPTPGRKFTLPQWVLPTLILIGALVACIWWLVQDRAASTVTAVRSLPPHVPSHESFPVAVTVRVDPAGSFPFILSESLPAGYEVVTSEPLFTTFDPETRELKWISEMDRGRMVTFFYLMRATGTAEEKPAPSFAGHLTVHQHGETRIATGGEQTIQIKGYHWADTNADNTIDDREILTVYDQFSTVDQLDFGRDLIESIWAAEGYRWDDRNGYLVVE